MPPGGRTGFPRGGPRLLLPLPILLLGLILSASCSWQGEVVGVTDGDTIKVMHGRRAETIRLYGIDAPERHQDFGEKAKEFTSRRVFGRVVTVHPVTRDRYGRTVGIVLVGGEVLNTELVEAGYAWVYDEYCRRVECAQLRRSQARAKEARRGLWSSPHPIPPWEFRHERE